MHAVAVADAAARALTRQLACSKSTCRCHATERKGIGLTHCPSHSDNDPSFNVSIKNGVLLVHCQTGCEQSVVVKALVERDLWVGDHERAKDSKRTIVATYDYRDPHGKLLYQAVRYSPKDFAQRRPDGQNKWIWNLEGVQRVLYKLPELLAAEPKRLRFIVEGEKDVETLMRYGFVATSNVGGAGSWRPEYSEWFHDRDVVLVPDNDDKGHAHMVKVAESLQGIARSTRWLALPGIAHKGDTSDWFDAGGTDDEFKLLVRTAKFYSTEVALQAQQPVNPLVDVFLERSVLAWCFETRDTVKYLRIDDFSDATLQHTLKQFRDGEYEIKRPDSLPEADPLLDMEAAITKLRDLSYRRESIKVAESIMKAATEVTIPFDPCIASDLLGGICESVRSHTSIAQPLSDCLDLS